MSETKKRKNVKKTENQANLGKILFNEIYLGFLNFGICLHYSLTLKVDFVKENFNEKRTRAE